MFQLVNAPRRCITRFGTACGGRATPTTARGVLRRLGAVLLVLAVCTIAVAADDSRPPPGAPVAAGAATPSSIAGPASDGAAVFRAALLPKDLSVWGMFLSADRVVKGVMIGLVLASIATWTVALAKSLELAGERTRLRKALDGLGDATDLADAVERAAPSRAAGALVAAAASEIELSSDLSDRAGIKERVASRLERIESNAGRTMARGTGILATVGAIAPFVGLFGTVWGIMNSFIGISQQQTTNLAVVAPGIAEALLATALGLVAAVPAVVVYNACSRAIAAYRALQADAAAAVLRLVSRDLDRAAEARSDAGRGRLLERARKA